MALIRFVVNTSGGTHPLEFRLNGGAWQENNVFEIDSVAAASGVFIETRDANGCIDSQDLTEDPIAFVSLAGFTSTGNEVTAVFETNILAEAQIDWGVGESFPYDPNNFQGTTDYNGTFTTHHEIKFPTSFIGSFHFFRARVKSIFGQEKQSVIRGIFYVPDELTQPKPIYTYVESVDKFIPETKIVENTGNISLRTQLGPQQNPIHTLSTSIESVTKPTVKQIDQQVNAIALNVIIT